MVLITGVALAAPSEGRDGSTAHGQGLGSSNARHWAGLLSAPDGWLCMRSTPRLGPFAGAAYASRIGPWSSSDHARPPRARGDGSSCSDIRRSQRNTAQAALSFPGTRQNASVFITLGEPSGKCRVNPIGSAIIQSEGGHSCRRLPRTPKSDLSRTISRAPTTR